VCSDRFLPRTRDDDDDDDDDDDVVVVVVVVVIMESPSQLGALRCVDEQWFCAACALVRT
jgi:hypothetical protein